jgi:hypothetical protein
MTSQEAYYNLRDLFKNLETHRSLSDLEVFTVQTGLDEPVSHFYEKYPKLKIGINKDEIVSLKKEGILDEENKINTDNFTGTPLERLLAAALWKNGDINKLQHIVDGILQTNGFRTDYSLIFKQFGHSLTNTLEPIVDQHVLRAFEIYSLPEYSEHTVNSLRKISIYKKSDKPLLDSYREWFKKLVDHIPQNEQSDYKEKLDKVLFISGKAIKI